MAKKTDPSITFLNKWGYNVVKLPRAGIEPLDVIGKDKTTQYLGPIDTVWTSSEPKPVPGAPHPAAIVNGQKTDALDVSFGLDVLANALAAFGASAPSLKVAYHSARKVQFAYTGVTSTSVTPFAAGNYLAKGTLREDNPAVKHYFEGKGAKTFLITEVLKSDSITVTTTDEHGTEVGVDVPAIQGMVGASVKVKPSGTSGSTMTFVGPAAVTFGFVVQAIKRVEGLWTLEGMAASGHIAFGMGAQPKAKGVVLETDGSGECRLDL